MYSERAFGNFKWILDYGHVEAAFLNPGISNHSPILIQVSTRPSFRPILFRLFNNVLDNPYFIRILTGVWGRRFTG